MRMPVSMSIKVRSTMVEAEVTAAAEAFASRHQLDATAARALARDVRAAVTTACQDELKLLQEASGKMTTRVQELAAQVVHSEEARLHHQTQADQTTKKLHSTAAQARKQTEMLSEFEIIDAKVVELQKKGCTTSSKLATMLAEIQTQLEAKKAEIQALDGQNSMDDEFSVVDADGDGVISPEEMVVWSEKKRAMLKRANTQRQQLTSENARLRSALNGTLAGGAESIEALLRQKDKETAVLADKLSGTRLANQNIEHEMRVIALDMQGLKEEVSRIEDRSTVGDGGSGDVGHARERAQVMKNWSDEKEGVLTIHERARQEWEHERATLQAEIDAREDF